MMSVSNVVNLVSTSNGGSALLIDTFYWSSKASKIEGDDFAACRFVNDLAGYVSYAGDIFLVRPVRRFRIN